MRIPNRLEALLAERLDSMRHARLLLPALLALATAACSGQKPAYYVTDAATGQTVSTSQQSTSLAQRGLFSSGSGQASYAYAAPQSQVDGGGRGLFNSGASDIFDSGLFSGRSRAPVYSYQPQPPQTYAYQPPPQQTYPQQSATMQQRPPQPAPQAYAQQPYQQPQPQPTGYYAERYRWY
jgi:hypothetical protein